MVQRHGVGAVARRGVQWHGVGCSGTAWGAVTRRVVQWHGVERSGTAWGAVARRGA